MLKLRVSDMNCGHCVATIEKAAKSVDPAAQVDVDLTTRVARPDEQPLPPLLDLAVLIAGPRACSKIVRANGFCEQRLV